MRPAIHSGLALLRRAMSCALPRSPAARDGGGCADSPTAAPAATPTPRRGGVMPRDCVFSFDEQLTPAGPAPRRGIFVPARTCDGCRDQFLPVAPSALLCAPCHLRRCGAA